jgi:hypothetical protein
VIYRAAVGIATPVFRLYRSRGAGGCEHHLLARAGRPSYPNHDAAAEQAADAFASSALDHLTGWWTRWLLPTQCSGSHEYVTVGETSYVAADDGPDLWDGPGLREVDLYFATAERDILVIGAADDESVFWLGVGDEPDLETVGLTRPARRIRVDFLTDLDGGGDLHDLVEGG